MQNQVAINQCRNATTGTSYTLTDTRDTNTYTVKKLADGKCWMTQDLRLTGSRRFYSTDSNISATYWDLPAVNTSLPSTSCVDTAYNMSSGDTTYGYYYNWYAATAGTGTCSMTSSDAGSSICPKGWRLPTGGSSGEFQALYNKYSSVSAMMGDPAFVLSGGRFGSNTRSQGSGGYYWSSTAANSAYSVYHLGLSSSGVLPANTNTKYNGFTLRCVAK